MHGISACLRWDYRTYRAALSRPLRMSNSRSLSLSRLVAFLLLGIGMLLIQDESAGLRRPSNLRANVLLDILAFLSEVA